MKGVVYRALDCLRRLDETRKFSASRTSLLAGTQVGKPSFSILISYFLVVFNEGQLLSLRVASATEYVVAFLPNRLGLGVRRRFARFPRGLDRVATNPPAKTKPVDYSIEPNRRPTKP